MILRAAALLLALAVAWPAQAEDGCPRRRHVDCAGQARAIAAAIAGDPGLALAEDVIARRVAALAASLPPPAVAALARADALRRRARARELFFTPDGLVEPDSIEALHDTLAWHLDWLARIDPAPPPGFAGRWDSGFVNAEVTRHDDGGFSVAAGAVEPFHLAWTCEFAEGAQRIPDGTLVSDDGELRLRRDGPLLVLEPIPRPGRAGFDYCGAMGSLHGTLFYLGRMPQNPTQAPR